LVLATCLLWLGCDEAPTELRETRDGLNAASLQVANGDPLINEFVFNHTGPDTHEFVEILGGLNTDYSAFTILEIEGDASGAGVIDGAFTVGTTDANGFWTTGFFSNVVENGTVTLLLVEGFTGAVGDDLDADNDGVPDAAPWTRIVDDVAVTDGGASDHTYAAVVLAGGFDGNPFTVGAASRIPNGVDTDAVSDWMRNDFHGEGLPGFVGTPEPGEALNTPGAVNAAVGVTVDPLINELVFNHTGSDTHEFVEIFGDLSTDYSSFTVLEIEGDAAGAGVIDGTFAIGTTDANGFWTTGFLSNVIENGTVTLVLVEGFTGTVGDDLDTDNDGVMDAAPWARIVDEIAVTDGGSSDHAYTAAVLAGGFDGNPFTVGGASRIPNGVDTDAVSDWMRNDFDGEGLPGFVGTPEPGEALNTPGDVNAPAVSSTDVLINEVDADNAGIDDMEFIELYDGGSGNTPLDGLVVVLYNGNGDISYAAFDLDGLTTGPSGFFVIGSPLVPNADFLWPDLTNQLQNGADAVALYAADASDFPFGTPVTTTNLVDAIVYDTNDADGPGLLVLLNAGQPQVNEGGAGDKDHHSNQRIPNGSGGGRNTDTYEQAIPTPGVSNSGGAAIDIEKATSGHDADEVPGPSIVMGAAVEWTYVVTNTGNVPLSNVAVTDDQGVAVSCPQEALAPGESMTCSASGTAQSGQYVNVGTASGEDPTGVAVTDDDPSHYLGVSPAAALEKATNGHDADAAPGPSILAGTPVEWTYLVTNTGDVSLANVAVTDDRGVAVSCPRSSLALGESMTCTPGQYANIGNATGDYTDDVGNSTVVNDDDPSHYFGATPAVDIEKATNGEDADDVTGPVIIAGTTVNWTYVVINTGNVPLANVTVTDDQGAAVSCPAAVLAVGESILCTANDVAVTGQYANLGSASADYTDDLGNSTTVSDRDPSHYFGLLEVAIDIRPSSINCRNGNGVIPVAILTTEDFDATTVDHTTVRFGPSGAAETHDNKQGVTRHEGDEDGDGDRDLVLHFRRGETGIQCGDGEATLTGETFDGVRIIGSDDFRTVPAN
jgi:hypothetical protein